MTTLYITGAGSAPTVAFTFRGEDGYWTIVKNYTPQEMATRHMYETAQGSSCFGIIGALPCHNVPPNTVHHWLAGQCNAGAAI